MSKHQLRTNVIYCGDNLDMLKEVPDESVDLIYIDPPFNSGRTYEMFWGDAQEKRAFEDRFGDAQAYIAYMRPRVVELYRVLKPTGSLYYHCDWHASHYIKLLLDQVFSFNNFRREIIWSSEDTSGFKSQAKNWVRAHDTIFFYTKTKSYSFNEEYQEHKPEYVARFKKIDEKGHLYRDDRSGGRRQYLSSTKGKRIGDVWSDIMSFQQASTSKEYQGYPTQKPLALLDRIIAASSNKGDIILDAFCGCGTALLAAHRLERKWIGIDISPTACRVMAQRLWDDFKLEEGKDFELVNMLRDEKQLREMPPFEFENWAVVAIGGIPNRVKVGDYGIDGRLYPIDRSKVKSDEKGLFGDIDTYYPIQVKQKDKAGRMDIDSFEAAMRRDRRRKGYFISFDFTSDAKAEIRRLYKGGELEIVPITVKELLDKSGYEVVR